MALRERELTFSESYHELGILLYLVFDPTTTVTATTLHFADE